MYKFVAVIVFRFPPTIVFVAANVFRSGPPSRSCAVQNKSWGCCSLFDQRKPQGTWPTPGPGPDLPLRVRRFTRPAALAAPVPGGTAFWTLAPSGAGSAFPFASSAPVLRFGCAGLAAVRWRFACVRARAGAPLSDPESESDGETVGVSESSSSVAPCVAEPVPLGCSSLDCGIGLLTMIRSRSPSKVSGSRSLVPRSARLSLVCTLASLTRVASRSA